MESEYSARVESAKSSFPFFMIFILLLVFLSFGLAFYYRQRFGKLKDSLYVYYSNYSNEPRHFDNPIYSSTSQPSTSALLNNVNKNTNMLKSKLNFDSNNLESDDKSYNSSSNNIYVELEDDKLNKVSNFYHTIDEMNLKPKRLNNGIWLFSYFNDDTDLLFLLDLLSPSTSSPSKTKLLPSPPRPLSYVNTSVMNDYDIPKSSKAKTRFPPSSDDDTDTK